jgi:hypothetical protein
MLQAFKMQPSVKTSIEVSPYFATLLKENEDYYIFQFSFSILRSYIQKNNLTKVLIKISNPNVVLDKDGNLIYSPSLLGSSKKITNKSGLQKIDDMLNDFSNKIKISEKEKNSIIAQQSVNLSFYAKLNPSIQTLLSLGIDPKDIVDFYSISNELVKSEKSSNDTMDVQNSNFEPRKNNLDLISRYGVDPAYVVSSQYFSSPSIPYFHLSENLRKYYLNSISSLPKDNVYYTSENRRSFNDKIFIPVFIGIPKKLSASDVEVTFEVFKNYNFGNSEFSELPAQIIVKKLPISKHQKINNLIKKPPTIGYSKNCFSIFQIDENAKEVQILKKEIDNRGNCSNYVKFNKNYLEYRKKYFIDSIFSSPESAKIYRVISSNQSTSIAGATFNSIVVSNPYVIDPTSLILTTENSCIKIMVKNSPFDAIQFAIQRKTFSDKKIEIISQFSNLDISNNGSSVVNDQNVKDKEIYEYTVLYKNRDGTIKTSISRTYRYSIHTPIVTVVSNPKKNIDSNTGETTVSFDISNQNIKKEEDFIKSVLQQSGLGDVFKDEIESIKENYSSLIGYSVTRINLNTGISEEFANLENSVSGTDTTVVNFSDSNETRTKNSVSPIDKTTDYLYEIRASMKDPAILLRDYVKEVKTQYNKTHYYRPYRWFQHKTLRTGTMLAEDNDGSIFGSKWNATEDAGVTASTLVKRLNDSLVIQSIQAERLNINNIKIYWEVTGDINDYDHFVVIKEVNREKKFLGAVFTQELIDVLQKDDLGTLIYYVIPVFRNYDVGKSVRTNSIIVDPKEFLKGN